MVDQDFKKLEQWEKKRTRNMIIIAIILIICFVAFIFFYWNYTQEVQEVAKLLERCDPKELCKSCLPVNITE